MVASFDALIGSLFMEVADAPEWFITLFVVKNLESPGEGNGYPLQYSCLENPMEREVWQATGVESSRVREPRFGCGLPRWR